MKELLDTLDAWRADGVDVGRAVVVRTFGSRAAARGRRAARTPPTAGSRAR